jgi:hypothetical protein
MFYTLTAMAPCQCSQIMSTLSEVNKNKQTPWSLVRERNIPTERPPLVDEI